MKWWEDCGTVGTTGQGLIPLTWQEIAAWRTENQLVLNNFEITCIKSMSREYVGEYYAAADNARPAPYSTIVGSEESLTESVALGNAFIELFGSPEQKSKLLQP